MASSGGEIAWHAATGRGELVSPMLEVDPKWRRTVMERQRLQVLYSGHVQGVGFRYTVKTLALGYEVTGTIRNLPNGRVELLAEGAKDELRAFLQAVRDSGLGPMITHEDVSWSDARNEFRGFAIIG